MVKPSIGIGDDWESQTLRWSKERLISFLKRMAKEKSKIVEELELAKRRIKELEQNRS